MHDAHKYGFPKITRLAYDFMPVLEYVQADQSELHFGGKAVVHAYEGRGSPAASAPHVIFIEHNDSSGLALRQVECDRGSHYPGAQDHDVGGWWGRVRVGLPGAHAG